MDLRKIFKKDTPEYAIPANLSKEDKKKVAQLIAKAKRNDGVPRTAQQSIPFERMFQDGICRVNADYYTKTIEFQDINYQLAQPEDKTTIFEEWCSFLNFFDSAVHFEISFMNMATDAESFEKSIAIEHVFYCDPQRPDQKGSIEVTHEFIRRIIPKKTSFAFLTQEKVDLMMSHINSYTRKKLSNRSAHQLFSFFYGEDTATKLNLKAVPANEIILKPELLK